MEMIHGAYPEWLIMGDPSMVVWDYQNRTTQGYWVGKREGSQPSCLHSPQKQAHRSQRPPPPLPRRPVPPNPQLLLNLPPTYSKHCCRQLEPT